MDRLDGLLRARADRRRVSDRPRSARRPRPRRAPLEHLASRPPPPGSRSSCAAGSGRAAPRAAGTCPRTRSGSGWRGRGTASASGGSTPSAVTWRSCIASSSAACVLAGARLISSASTSLPKIGPGGTRSRRARGRARRPVTSAGMRSGVNWMRANESRAAAATATAVSVFANAGTSSSRTWPSARNPSSTSSRTSRLPTTARSTSSRMRSATSRTSAGTRVTGAPGRR